ncbi:sodium:proton antiporter [Ignisphaera sp. 4213-co]|uniref:Sodium:proton antiporter n=1 Tax=Ignisphaera cupida TaxID=3050454 RepID=A0ABD4Z5K0_9CREN|nr:sodium:proton antiporter [Ignisphaera sp. 4213-co]MDK6028586.1 sodium:proton antiporter [Ignisphaera sp. 4213-co]
MSNVESFLLTSIVISLIINTAISLYGVFSKPSLIKKFIALTIFSDSINSFAIFIGFRRTSEAYPSIAVHHEIPRNVTEIHQFVSSAVDPLPQALVLTAIVIGLAVNMFLIGLIILFYKYYGTTNVRKVRI